MARARRTSTTRGRRVALTSLGLSSALLLAACGGDEPEEAAAPATPSAGGASSSAAGSGEAVAVGLITKTNTNPFFVKMKEGAEAAGKESNVKIQAFAGKQDGDNQTQVEAVENLISQGAKGILITPNDSKGIVPAIDKARQAELLVIALDTPLEPADAADATFATDNYQAGKLIGQWAKATFEKQKKEAKIALLDLNPQGITVDVQRDQGFLEGFGIDVKDKTKIGDEDDPRIVGHDVTDGAEEGGRTAMENLLQKDPAINLVYTINEPAAAGAYEAIKAAGKEKDVTIVSVDGGCPGVDNVKKGVIGATSMQYPLKMASLGVEAVKKFAEDGTKPTPSEGLDFTNTGVDLITDAPVDGVESKDTKYGTENCWG